LRFVILNRAATPQTVTLTAWNISENRRTVGYVGPVTVTIPAGETFSDSIGASFVINSGQGHFMELELQCQHPNVMATASLYERTDSGDIALTRYVPAGDWVRLR
jgi:hypothetical protein